jgi:hypothetical protein
MDVVSNERAILVLSTLKAAIRRRGSRSSSAMKGPLAQIHVGEVSGAGGHCGVLVGAKIELKAGFGIGGPDENWPYRLRLDFFMRRGSV